MGGFLFALFAPSNSLLLLLGLGLLLAAFGRRRVGLGLAGGAFLAFVAWGVTPIGHALITPLETRFPQPDHLPEKIAGIIVLGGSIDPLKTYYWQQPALNDRAERLTAGVGLARRYPDAPLVFTGGQGLFGENFRFTEADAAAMFFDEQQVENPIILEAASHNTHDNATNLAEILPKDRPGPWVLVTSAYHMPRSVGVFRKAGVDVIPYPVDYKDVPELSGWWYEIARGAHDADFAARAWVALFVYHLRDWTDDLFPRP
jgi:uncharacterized SAM-binding protein YcdF (DUF218 family)